MHGRSCDRIIDDITWFKIDAAESVLRLDLYPGALHILWKDASYYSNTVLDSSKDDYQMSENKKELIVWKKFLKLTNT